MKQGRVNNIYTYIHPERDKILLSLAASILMNLFAVGITWQFSDVIDLYIPAKDIQGILLTVGKILLFSLLYFLFYVLFLSQSKKAEHGVSHRLRNLVFSHVMNCRYEHFVKKSFGQVNTNIIQDVEAFCTGIFGSVFQSLADIVFFLITFGILLFVNVRITAVLFLYMAAVTLYMYSLKKYMGRFSKRYATARTHLNESIMDLTSHQKSIVLFEQQEAYCQKVDQKNAEMIRAWFKLNIFSPLIQSSIEVSTLISYLLAFAIGWGELKAGHASFGDIFLYLTYIPQLWNKYGSVIDIAAALVKSKTYAERIMAAIENEDLEQTKRNHQSSSQELSQTLSQIPSQETTFSGIEIQNLSFSFVEDHPIWKNFTASFDKPGTYGISGPSGCGKSTLFDILIGFYQADQGNILIRGNSIDSYSYPELRNMVGIVHQEPYFVNGSILDNIRFYNNTFSKKEIEDCFEKYGLSEQKKLLDMYQDESLTRNDRRLTLGQKRIISLVRILARKPDILLLDEVTAGLDSYTEELVLRIIQQVSRECVCIMISHKSSDLRIADQVIQL